MVRTDRRLAVELRKAGKSYNDISVTLGIPKSTLVYWFKDEKWSSAIKSQLTYKAQARAKKRLQAMSLVNKQRWEMWRAGFRAQAEGEFNKLKNNNLFLAGLMLYWAEGDSNIKNPLRLANVTPEIIKLYIKFLIEICCVEKSKIKINLIIYPDLNEKICKRFWMKQTSLSEDNFYKTQIIQGKHPTKRINHGVCLVIVSSRGLKEKVQCWIQLTSQRMLNAGVI